MSTSDLRIAKNLQPYHLNENMEKEAIPKDFSHIWNNPGTEMCGKYCIISLICGIKIST